MEEEQNRLSSNKIEGTELAEVISADTNDSGDLEQSDEGLSRSSETSPTIKKRIEKKIKEMYRRVKESLSIYVLGTCLALAFWFLSLIGCTGDIIVCVNQLEEEAPYMVLKLALFSFINFLLLIYACKRPDPIDRYLGYLIISSTYIYIYMTGKGFSQEDHSQLNMAVAFAFFFGYLAITGTVIGMVRLWRKSRFGFWSVVAGFLILVWLFWALRVSPSCSRWGESLHPDYTYSEDNGVCKWKKPEICWHYITTGVYKPLFWGRTSCATYETDLTKHREVAGPNKIMSYGLSNKLDYFTRVIFRDIQRDLNNSASISSAEEMESGNRESFIDFRDSEDGEFKIKLKDLRNFGLNRQLLPHDKKHMNILNFFIDTVSRQRIYRAMPKTAEVLRNFHFTKNKRTRVYEFFRMHAIAGYSWPNLMAEMYGTPRDGASEPVNWNFKHFKRVDSLAKENGYITGYASNFCNVNEKEHDGKDGFILRRQYIDPVFPDHEFIQPGCDYNSFPMNNGFGFFLNRGPFSTSRKCFMKRDQSEYSFQYLLDFFNTYKDERKFFTLRMIDPHELSEEVPKIIDGMIADFITRLIEEGHLDNTLVFFHSDHGDHVNLMLMATESFKSERFNPFMYVMAPDHIKDTDAHENLVKNSQKLVGHKDIFTTALGAFGVDKHEQIEGFNLLATEVPEDRNCGSIGVFNGDECLCNSG